MTKKDYVLIAEALNECKPANHENPFMFAQWMGTCQHVATALLGDNQAFNHERFMDACKGA